MDNQLELALEYARVAAEKRDAVDSQWEYNKYFQRVEGCFRQEHIIYKTRPTGRIERITITRTWFADGDWQDSTESVII